MEPSHVLMRETPRRCPFAPSLRTPRARRCRRSAAITTCCVGRAARLDIWHTVYNHPLADAAAIVEWVKSTGLKPFPRPAGRGRAGTVSRGLPARIDAAYPRASRRQGAAQISRLFIVPPASANSRAYQIRQCARQRRNETADRAEGKLAGGAISRCAVLTAWAGAAVAKSARCFTTDDGYYSCSFRGLDEAGSFRISAPGLSDLHTRGGKRGLRLWLCRLWQRQRLAARAICAQPRRRRLLEQSRNLDENLRLVAARPRCREFSSCRTGRRRRFALPLQNG